MTKSNRKTPRNLKNSGAHDIYMAKAEHKAKAKWTTFASIDNDGHRVSVERLGKPTLVVPVRVRRSAAAHLAESWGMEPGLTIHEVVAAINEREFCEGK